MSITIGIGGEAGSYGYGIGGSFTYQGWGAGYTYTHYGAGIVPFGGQAVGTQNTGAITAYWPGGSFSIENDAFVRGGEDRWRTSAWELSFANNTLSVGSYIYTNDPKNDAIAQGADPKGVFFDDRFMNEGGTNLRGKTNRPPYGAWLFGEVYSSPLWVGYRVGNTVSRIGYSHPMVQDRTQNLIHKYFPLGRQNFYNQYAQSTNGFYYYSGYYDPFTLYGR